MSEIDPAQVESLLETRSRLQCLLSYAEAGMKSSAISLIKKQLLNSQSGDAGFFVGVMNSIRDTALRANLQDCLWALLSMTGRPAPELFGERGLYPNLPAHEQWHKSIAVLKGTVASLATLQSGAVEQQQGHEVMDPCLVGVPPNADSDQTVRVDARKLLRDAEEVLRFLQRLPSETTAELKHWPTSFLFRSFFHFVERLAMHLRPISENRPAVERDTVTLDGIADGDRAEFVAWSQSLENLLREICLERFGARFFFATQADTGERLIYFESRELTAFSPSRAGLPNPEVASLAKLQTADIDGLNQFISELSELVGRASCEKNEIERDFTVFGHTKPHSQNPEEAVDSSMTPVATPDAIAPACSGVPSDAERSGKSPEFTGPWKHVYVFLWQQKIDLSHSQDDYKPVFEQYRSLFGKKTSGSGKRKKHTYRMPSHSDAKSIRQGYHRQLKRLTSRK